MHRRALAAVVPLALMVCPAAASAADDPPAAPFVTPQHDVDVNYVIAGQTGVAVSATPQTQRMRWSASLWRQRLDPPGQTSMITDYRAQTLLMLDRSRQVGLLLPAPANQVPPPGTRTTGRVRRLGAQIVAGTACTEWRMADDSGADSVVCFTDDGVMLRARQGSGSGSGSGDGRTLIEASRVLYGPQDPALFEAPPGTTVQRTSPPSSR